MKPGEPGDPEPRITAFTVTVAGLSPQLLGWIGEFSSEIGPVIGAMGSLWKASEFGVSGPERPGPPIFTFIFQRTDDPE